MLEADEGEMIYFTEACKGLKKPSRLAKLLGKSILSSGLDIKMQALLIPTGLWLENQQAAEIRRKAFEQFNNELRNE